MKDIQMEKHEFISMKIKERKNPIAVKKNISKRVFDYFFINTYIYLK